MSSSYSLRSRDKKTAQNNCDLKTLSMSCVVEITRMSKPSKDLISPDTSTNQVPTAGEVSESNNEIRDKTSGINSKTLRNQEPAIIKHLTLPIWTHPPEKVTKAEYLTLYKFLHAGKNIEEALACKHFVIQDEDIQFRAILYIPFRPPIRQTLFNVNDQFTFCVKEKFIFGSCENLLPEYLSFFKGVIESEKIHSICTRPMLPGGDQIFECVQRNVIFKALELIQQVAEDSERKESKDQFYNQYLPNIKQGILNERNGIILRKLCQALRFQTSFDTKQWWSFADYVSRMKTNQNRIYYALGESREQVLSSDFCFRRAVKQGFEVIIMSWPQDEEIVRKLNLNGNVLASVDQEFEFDEEEDVDDINDDSFNKNSIAAQELCTSNHSELLVSTKNTATRPPNQVPIRKQPARQVRSAFLEKSKKTAKSKQKKVDERVIDYEGKMLTMKEFKALPVGQRHVIEAVDKPFFDIKRKSLCFRVKWKYYPDKHREKFNNEWADNLQNFDGGIKAVEKYFSQDPHEVDEADKDCFEMAKIQWDEIKKNFDEESSSSLLPSTSSEGELDEVVDWLVSMENESDPICTAGLPPCIEQHPLQNVFHQEQPGCSTSNVFNNESRPNQQSDRKRALDSERQYDSSQPCDSSLNTTKKFKFYSYETKVIFKSDYNDHHKMYCDSRYSDHSHFERLNSIQEWLVSSSSVNSPGNVKAAGDTQ